LVNRASGEVNESLLGGRWQPGWDEYKTRIIYIRTTGRPWGLSNQLFAKGIFAAKENEAEMIKMLPYLLDVASGLVFILLPGIRGYGNWSLPEYGLLLFIYGYIVYQHHHKPAASHA
jgi:hypothetical protein